LLIAALVPRQSNGIEMCEQFVAGLPDGALAIAEENFGPIAAFTQCTDMDNAYARANATEFGLSADVFTHNPQRISEAVANLAANIAAKVAKKVLWII
jgi:succinate-semialdehyde dehydrogenase / glutarate-semialdehyde dehydrogenase